MKKTNALRISMKLMRNAIIGISITTLSISPFKSDSQVIRSYIQNNNVKNYSIEEIPGTAGSEFVMAGTIFDNSIPANSRAAVGRGIHFMRVDAVGKTKIYTGTTPNYVVSKRYDFNQYADVRCIDIVPYSNNQSLIVANARYVNWMYSGDFRYNKDLILVLKVDNISGDLLNTYQLSYFTTPNAPHWGIDNLYATHAIYHRDINAGKSYLYICGYDGIETSYPNYPEYIPHNGPSCYDKRIMVTKFDINSATPSVVSTRTWDYPWVNCSTTEEYPYIYDFDMALRMVPINDGTGDIYVTGTTNSDFTYETRPPFPVWIPSYGSGTLSLRINEQTGLNTVAIRPFIEHNLVYSQPPFITYHDGFYEQGFGAFEDNTGNGLYVFSNQFTPMNAEGYGVTEGGTTIKMTYIDKTTLNFGKYPDIHRFAWAPIDYDWGTQVLPSPNGTNKLYLAGLQYGWDYGNYTPPSSPNQTPSIIDNVNPFLAELEPSFTAGSPSTIGLTNTNFWKVYFNMNKTGYFKDLGGGLSNPYWSTEFLANSAPSTGPVFTSPSWFPSGNGGTGALNHKFTRTDVNGDITTGYTDCDNSYANTPHIDDYLVEVTDAWFMNKHEEDVPTISTESISYADNLFAFSYDPYCGETGYNPYFKSTGIISINNTCSFDIYPNPSSGYISIKPNGINKDQVITAELFNMIGQQVAVLYNGIAEKINEKQLSLKNVAKGAYMVKISSNNQLLQNTKLIVQ